MNLEPAVLIGAALIAVVGASVLRLAADRGSRALGVAALALLFAVVAYGAWNPVRSSERAIYPSGWTDPGPAAGAARALRPQLRATGTREVMPSKSGAAAGRDQSLWRLRDRQAQ